MELVTTINEWMDVGLLLLLLLSGLMLMASNSPVTITVLSALFSLSICTLFVVLDAVDVAFTEAAVGAGISTLLFLSVLRLDEEPQNPCFQWPSWTSICVGLLLGGLLLFGTLEMPLYGNPEAPIHQYLVPRFIYDSGVEIGVPNMVTSVLASYRGYDTWGEVLVIFTAGLGVFLLLSALSKPEENQPEERQIASNPIMKAAFIRIIPLVLLFALYVQFHGDYGPGGGFQAGVIFAAGLITYALLTNVHSLLSVVSRRWINFFTAFGALLYGGVGVMSLLLDGEFLNYSVLSSTQTAGQHLGILVIELGVGITVAFTMLSLYVSFNEFKGRSG